jgi:hypothetical protein
MIYIVEIVGPGGGRGGKGYEADTFRTALRLAADELSDHPDWRITNIRGNAATAGRICGVATPTANESSRGR